MRHLQPVQVSRRSAQKQPVAVIKADSDKTLCYHLGSIGRHSGSDMPQRPGVILIAAAADDSSDVLIH